LKHRKITAWKEPKEFKDYAWTTFRKNELKLGGGRLVLEVCLLLVALIIGVVVNPLSVLFIVPIFIAIEVFPRLSEWLSECIFPKKVKVSHDRITYNALLKGWSCKFTHIRKLDLFDWDYAGESGKYIVLISHSGEKEVIGMPSIIDADEICLRIKERK